MNKGKTIDVPMDAQAQPTNEPPPQRAVTVRDAVGELDAPAPRTGPMDLLQLAVEKGNVNVDTLDRLMAVRRELNAEKAREEYFAALAAFQAECPIILRSRAGHENRYNYAPLERIVKDVTPFLTKHGFSHQEDGVVTEGWVEAIVTVTHRSGHQETKRFKVPAQSNAGMSPQQKYGAAMTYATRYAFCAAFGIRTADRDTDGPSPEGGPEVIIGLKTMVWNILRKHNKVQAGQTWADARQYFVDEMVLDDSTPIESLDAAAWRKLLAALNRKLEGK